MNGLDYEQYDELEDINLNYVDRIQDQSSKPMTTVVGIKSNAGVVLASDSQWTSNVKAFSSKLFEVNRNTGLGVSGTRSYIRLLLKKLQQELRTDDLRNEEDFRHSIDKLLAQLFRERVTNRSTELGYFKVANIFDATALLGARLSGGEYGLYRLSLVPPDPVVEIVENYDAVGTGMDYAYLLLRQQTRMVLTSENGISNTDLKSNIWLATLIISEIKTFDKYSSGNTHIATIDKYGYKEYSRKEIVETYESKREELVTLAHSLGVEKEVARSTHPMHPDP